MPLKIVILICEDPTGSHRPVEGLRIALGLSTGPNPLTIIIMGKARLLLTEETSDVIDSEILEKHLPVLEDLQVKILLPTGSLNEYSIDSDLSISESSPSEITSCITLADRVLVF
jgi:sulfur relay (sulfurtransferase) DsrF/TusC family protein